MGTKPCGGKGLHGAARVGVACPVVPLRLAWGVGPSPVLRGSLGRVMGPEFCSFQMEWNRRPRPKAFSGSCDRDTSEPGALVKACIWRPVVDQALC